MNGKDYPTARWRRAAIASVLGFSVLTVTPATASAASAEQHTSGPASNLTRGLSAQQWQSIADNARAAGDLTAAKAAHEAVGRVRSTGGVATQSISSIARKLIKAALKYGRQYLPPKVRAWADKLYDLIDGIEVTTELGITSYLVSQGIPYDVARATAQWILFFL